HSPGAADAGMRDVAIAADLVRRVDDHHTLAQLVREQPRALSQHRGLADTGPPEQQDALAADHYVSDDLAGAGDRAADAHRKARDAARAVAGDRPAVEGRFAPGEVVVAELPDVVGDMLEVRGRNRSVGEQDLASGHT